MIKRHEGYRSKPYLCSAGKLTIGWGHNLDDNGISKTVAELMLDEDIQSAYYDIMDIFPNFYLYSQKRQNALIDMMFNLGKPSFRGFGKMIAAIKKEDWKEVAVQAKDSDWYRKGKRRATKIEQMLRDG